MQTEPSADVGRGEPSAGGGEPSPRADVKGSSGGDAEALALCAAAPTVGVSARHGAGPPGRKPQCRLGTGPQSSALRRSRQDVPEELELRQAERRSCEGLRAHARAVVTDNLIPNRNSCSQPTTLSATDSLIRQHLAGRFRRGADSRGEGKRWRSILGAHSRWGRRPSTSKLAGSPAACIGTLSTQRRVL